MQIEQENIPLVTVIAACYNHERFVIECLESIRAQTYSNIQLIIMDDCSQDHSVAHIQQWMEQHHVQCIFKAHPQNMGLPKTLNEALRLAEGVYISIIATDDCWLPNFIEDRVNLLESHDATYGLVYGKSYIMDEQGAQIPGLVQKSLKTPDGCVTKDLLEQNFVSANTVLLRRSCYEKTGQYDESLIIEDYDMWLRIARRFKFIYSKNILSKYRIVSTSMVRSRIDEIQVNVAKIMVKNLSLQPEYSKIIEERLKSFRTELYKIGYIKTSKYILMALAEKVKKKDLAMLIFFLLGFPYSTFEKLVLHLSHKAEIS